MSEQNESTPKPTPPAGAPEGAPVATAPQPQGDAELGDAGKRAIAAEREARKAAEAAATAAQAELDQIRQAQMSDLEKAQAQAKTSEEEAAKARAEALRWRIAAKHGIGDEDAETFLTGSDEASLTRQAERLASLAAASTAPTTPKPDLSQGGSGGSNSTAEDQIAAAEKSGDTKTAITLKAQQLAKLATADN